MLFSSNTFFFIFYPYSYKPKKNISQVYIPIGILQVVI